MTVIWPERCKRSGFEVTILQLLLSQCSLELAAVSEIFSSDCHGCGGGSLPPRVVLGKDVGMDYVALGHYGE